MGAIDDVRKVIQDLVAPELKSLHVELKRVDETSKLRDEALSAKIDALSDKMDIKLEALSGKMDLKFDLVMTKMEAIQASLLIDKRLEAIERKTAEPMHAA
jgi:ribosome maturation factor RimP